MPVIKVNDTSIYYIDTGPKDAPVIVCSHSMFFDSDMFREQAKALSAHYRIIRYDHRGQGKSARAPVEKLDMDTLTNDAIGLIETLKLDSCTFVGNSMGGFVALRLAARRPDLIRSVIALGTSADVEEHRDEMDRLNRLIAKDGIKPVLNDVLTFMLGKTTLTAPSRRHVLEYAKNVLLANPKDCSFAVTGISHRKSILHELVNIRCPILLVAGTEDFTYPPEKMEQIKNYVPHAEIEYMENTGHVHAIENPDGVVASLKRHMETLV